jgi:hypothetical protein
VTLVFRTSSFFVVFVITLKATTFVVGNTTNGNGAADRLNDHVERLVDEAVRFRGEAREAADHVVDMAFALHALGDRMIEHVRSSASVVAVRTRSAMRRIVRSACVNIGTAAGTLHTLWVQTPKKEVFYGGHIEA